jgi:hypothetical protein
MGTKRLDKPPTPEQLKRFDEMLRRETAEFMRNWMERKIAKARGQKMPRNYRLRRGTKLIE